MQSKTRIRFIVNPFSGVKPKKSLPRIIEEALDKHLFDHDLQFTEGPGHGAELSRDAVAEGYEIVVAIGGDGSINEVSAPLIGTDVALGIIPGGSGNGIARSLGIPLSTRQAVRLINKKNRVHIDTGRLADRPFIGIAGIGFDAHIGDRFLHRKLRGKLSYGYVMMKEFHRFSPFSFEIDGDLKSEKAFVLAFANTSQYGNNAVIAPLAEFQDGQLELVCINELKALRVPEMMLRLFNKSLDKSDLVKTMGFERIQIKHEANIGHVDGEPFAIASEVEVKVIPKSLWVLK